MSFPPPSLLLIRCVHDFRLTSEGSIPRDYRSLQLLSLGWGPTLPSNLPPSAPPPNPSETLRTPKAGSGRVPGHDERLPCHDQQTARTERRYCQRGGEVSISWRGMFCHQGSGVRASTPLRGGQSLGGFEGVPLSRCDEFHRTVFDLLQELSLVDITTEREVGEVVPSADASFPGVLQREWCPRLSSKLYAVSNLKI